MCFSQFCFFLGLLRHYLYMVKCTFINVHSYIHFTKAESHNHYHSEDKSILSPPKIHSWACVSFTSYSFNLSQFNFKWYYIASDAVANPYNCLTSILFSNPLCHSFSFPYAVNHLYTGTLMLFLLYMKQLFF